MKTEDVVTHEMFSASSEYASTSGMSRFPDENAWIIERGIRAIGSERKPGDVELIRRMYRIPKGAHQGDAIDPKEWIQTAGTTNRLTVEVKIRGDDEVYRQYVVGRHLRDQAVVETITVGENEIEVQGSEILSSDDAIELFSYYYDHDRVPDSWSLRELPEYAER